MLVFSAVFYIGSLVAVILLYVFFTTVSQNYIYIACLTCNYYIVLCCSKQYRLSTMFCAYG